MKKKSADLFKVISKSGGPEHPLKSLAKKTENPSNDAIINKEATTGGQSLDISSRGAVEVRREPELHETVRQTFLISQAKLEAIKNIVYFKKINGNIYTTQQEVLEDAIDALLEKLGSVPDRPKEEKLREKQKRRGRKPKH